MALTITTTVRGEFLDVAERTRAALHEHGLGIITEIDMTATLKNKIDEDIEDYLILGACSPQFAHSAVTRDPRIGTLLPCNVVVRADRTQEGNIIVEAVDPRTLLTLVGDDDLVSAADQVADMLSGALQDLN